MTISNDLIHPDSRRRRYNVVRVSANHNARIDDYVACKTSIAAMTVTLPTSPSTGSCVAIGDDDGNASVNPITVEGGATIDGAPRLTLGSRNAIVELIFDGSEWRKIVSSRLVAALQNDLSVISVADLTRALGLAGIGTYAQRPGAGTRGAEFYATDSFTKFVDDGNAWRPDIFGRLGYEPPAIAGFTVRSNADIATVPTDLAGSLSFVFNNYNATAEELRCATKALPAGSFRCDAFVRLVMTTSGTLLGGLTFRQSSNGSVEQFSVEQTSGGAISFTRHRATASNAGTSPTYTFNSSVANTSAVFNTGIGGAPGCWLRIEDDRAGTRKFWFSFDAVNWFECLNLRVTGNAFLTADEWGVHAWGSSVAPGGGNIGAIFYSVKENTS